MFVDKARIGTDQCLHLDRKCSDRIGGFGGIRLAGRVPEVGHEGVDQAVGVSGICRSRLQSDLLFVEPLAMATDRMATVAQTDDRISVVGSPSFLYHLGHAGGYGGERYAVLPPGSGQLHVLWRQEVGHTPQGGEQVLHLSQKLDLGVCVGHGDSVQREAVSCQPICGSEVKGRLFDPVLHVTLGQDAIEGFQFGAGDVEMGREADQSLTNRADDVSVPEGASDLADVAL